MKSLLKILDQRGSGVALLLLSDILGGVLAFVAAFWVRNDVLGPAIQPFEEYAPALPMVGLIVVTTFYLFGLYERERRVTSLSEWMTLFRAVTAVWILCMAASFLYKYDTSRGLIVLFYGFGLLFLGAGRTVLRVWNRWLHRRGIGVIRVLIVGEGEEARQVQEALKRHDAFGYKVVEFYKGEWKALPAHLKSQKIEEVYVADSSVSHERILELVHRCRDIEVTFKIASKLFEIVAGEIDLKELEGLPALSMGRKGSRPVYRFFKRLMDLVGAAVALIVFAPFWILLVVAIRHESHGPALFRQERVGLRGKTFWMYKFRTMRSDADPNAAAPRTSNDPRITRVGRFLRRTSFDEWPQFWNILKGEMSLVGPRPEMPFIVKTYTEWQRARLDVKPGLTGLWQILGRKDLPLHENIEYDFYYIKNRSLLLDIVILLKTVSIIITGKGAY